MKTFSAVFKNRSFFFFFIAQSVALFNIVFFLSAASINIIKTLHVQVSGGLYAALITAVFCFMLPFYLFAGYFGQICTKYNNIKLFKIITGAQLMFILLFFGALKFSNIYLLWFAIVISGAYAGFIGILKNNALCNVVYEKEFPTALAAVEIAAWIAFFMALISSFIACVTGTLHLPWLIAVILMCTAISLLLALFIPNKEGSGHNVEIDKWPPYVSLLKAMAAARQGKRIFLSLFGAGWFYCIGLCLVSCAVYASYILKIEIMFAGVSLALITLAGVMGAVAAPYIFNGQPRIKHAALGLLLASVFMVDLAFVIKGLVLLGEKADFFDFAVLFIGKRFFADMFLIALFSGFYAVSVKSLAHRFSIDKDRPAIFAGAAMMNVLCLFVLLGVLGWLTVTGMKFWVAVLIMALTGFCSLIYLVTLLPGDVFKSFMRALLSIMYDVKVEGGENFNNLSGKTLIIANHTSFLDVPILWAFIPDKVSFAIDTYVAKKLWIKPFLYFIKHFPIDHTNPMGVKTIIDEIDAGRKVIIFPEGRITTTGSFMKIYPGPAMVADKSNADILPVCIEGSQYTMFSYFGNKIAKRPRSKVTMHVLKPRKLNVSAGLKGKPRRNEAARRLYDIMCEMKFTGIYTNQTLFDSLLAARKLVGKDKAAMEDMRRQAVSFGDFISSALAKAFVLNNCTKDREHVGFMLPNSCCSAATFFALSLLGRVPCLLDYSMKQDDLVMCCKSAKVKNIVTSKKFIADYNMQSISDALEHKGLSMIYMEDVLEQINWRVNVKAWLCGRWSFLRLRYFKNRTKADSPAVALFNLDSNGMPKGALLSHKNIQANKAQLLTVLDLGLLDVVFNPLPFYDALGFTSFMLSVTNGIKNVVYHCPSDARVVCELIYSTNSTVLFSADQYLAAYAQAAHPYDFYSLRFAIAANGPLKDSTVKTWSETFNVRLLNCYGLKPAFSVLTINTPMYFKKGSQGRFLPCIDYKIDPSNKAHEGRLYVKGLNVMAGMLAEPQDTVRKRHTDWFDTGAVVDLDEDSYLFVKNFC